ncbi:hypothetical protein B0H10DRAFT_2212751 [Mycena sp. CBHHK59/15]|nr:hypothetical protein B0H10DRAFT_2212751 [Mycena sp. CBHHK59/15]
MVSQPEVASVPSSPARAVVVAYEISTTSIIYGLPPAEQHHLLSLFRRDFHVAAAQQNCQVAYGTYDLCCQYYKNIHALVDAAVDDSICDSDSDSDTGSMPPLEPTLPSDGDPASTEINSSPEFVTASTLLAERDATREAVPASGGWGEGRGWGNWDGEQTERAWAEAAPPTPASQEMEPGLRHTPFTEEEGEVHDLQIVQFGKTRDVKCDCKNGKHSMYERRTSYAFTDERGNVVVKKRKTKLLGI